MQCWAAEAFMTRKKEWISCWVGITLYAIRSTSDCGVLSIIRMQNVFNVCLAGDQRFKTVISIEIYRDYAYIHCIEYIYIYIDQSTFWQVTACAVLPMQYAFVEFLANIPYWQTAYESGIISTIFIICTISEILFVFR